MTKQQKIDRIYKQVRKTTVVKNIRLWDVLDYIYEAWFYRTNSDKNTKPSQLYFDILVNYWKPNDILDNKNEATVKYLYDLLIKK